MTTSSDLLRYIEYLQRQLLSPEAEATFDHSKYVEWLQSERRKQHDFSTLYPGIYTAGLIAQYEQKASSFQPSTRFDTYSPKAIFDPILEEVMKIASAAGDGLAGEVSVAASTSSNPTAFARPADGHHLLFIGIGTSSFCNYWAKAYSALVNSLSLCANGKKMTADFVEDVLTADPSPLVLLLKLATYQALGGTLIGFGSVGEPRKNFPYRMQLLQSIEVFVVAHEYAHFLAEERIERFRGMLTEDDSHELETFCDRYGMSISQSYGANHENFLSFSGAGPTLLFRAMELVEVTRKILLGEESSEQDGHPAIPLRLTALQAQAISGVEDDQKNLVKEFLDEFNVICNVIQKMIREFLARMLPTGHSEDER